MSYIRPAIRTHSNCQYAQLTAPHRSSQKRSPFYRFAAFHSLSSFIIFTIFITRTVFSILKILRSSHRSNHFTPELDALISRSSCFVWVSSGNVLNELRHCRQTHARHRTHTLRWPLLFAALHFSLSLQIKFAGTNFGISSPSMIEHSSEVKQIAMCTATGSIGFASDSHRVPSIDAVSICSPPSERQTIWRASTSPFDKFN